MKHHSIASLVLVLGAPACLDPTEEGNLVPRTVEQDPSLPSIEVAGTMLHAEAFGDPTHPMVMVLHGGPGGDYRGLLPLRALADDGYFVVFWDQRGSGLSQRHDADVYTMPRYPGDLAAVLDYFRSDPEQRVVFIGHSWGAMLATWFINEHGDDGGRIAGAILSEPGAFTRDQVEPYFERLFGSVRYFAEDANDITWSTPFLSPREHALMDYELALQGAAGIPAEHADPADPAPRWRLGAVAGQAVARLGLEQGFDWTTDLDQFEPKVLFLRGELNEAMPLHHQQELASSYPSAQIITIPDVGHEMIWERPEAYLEHTRAYLDEIGFIGGTP